ncbi:hypothetical protein BK648_16590 [Pseudomonas poae]|uniref:Uncharacterized protein n=1 Tax=Pseudomonas poae TaxID=200451 RepID=A0A423EV93_9PSED|nr:hypothetical protein [Pseudomonas poae]ROM43533.1 hypothetical protein BK648_16590 [Pseudomonas poae]
MTDSRHTPDSDDALTRHFRQHSTGEPPASLDAFILATARREAPAPKLSLWQRWGRACRQPRWQMAFATVAGVALMLGVVMRTNELDPGPQGRLAAPATFSAPAPMSAPPQAESYSAPLRSDALPQGKFAKRAAPQSLEQGLLEVVRLRAAGDEAAATAKLAELKQRFPSQNIEEQLKALPPR